MKQQQTSSKWGNSSSQYTFFRLKHPLCVFALWLIFSGTLASVAAVEAFCSWSVESYAPVNLLFSNESLIATIPACPWDIQSVDRSQLCWFLAW